jgi:serine phosphatase RsbU (regulator of sigma subunit)
VTDARSGRQRRGIETFQQAFDRVEPADQQQVAALEVARMRGVGAVAALLERVARGFERLRRRPEVARDQRDLGLGDGATRARDRLARAEGARRALEQPLGARKIAEAPARRRAGR